MFKSCVQFLFVTGVINSEKNGLEIDAKVLKLILFQQEITKYNCTIPEQTGSPLQVLESGCTLRFGIPTTRSSCPRCTAAKEGGPSHQGMINKTSSKYPAQVNFGGPWENA